MITPKMCSRIFFYADRQRSRRYKRADLLDALNVAQQSVKLDRYDNIKRETGYSFELIQRVRDELYTLLRRSPSLPASGGSVTQPPDYDLEVLCYATINGKKQLSTSRTYEENNLSSNVYAKPSAEYPIHRKTATGWLFEWGAVNGMSTADLWYLIEQPEVDWSETNLGLGSVLQQGLTYYVNQGPITWNGITFQTGASFVATVPAQAITLGGTVNVIVNCLLPKILHEEVCKVAASILMGTFENYQKSIRIQQEVNRS